MKKLALLMLLVLAMPLAAQAQGVGEGAKEGAEKGNQAAGPVGGVVGVARFGIRRQIHGRVNGGPAGSSSWVDWFSFGLRLARNVLPATSTCFLRWPDHTIVCLREAYREPRDETVARQDQATSR